MTGCAVIVIFVIVVQNVSTQPTKEETAKEILEEIKSNWGKQCVVHWSQGIPVRYMWIE
jgi:uncharacterized protein (DUF2126 family)